MILEETDSKVNGHLRVVWDLAWGKHIQANGLTQSGGVVEEIWGKALRRVKAGRRQITSCLILGLGGGSNAKWVRRLWPKAKITGVEIDPLMIELGRKYLGLEKSGVEVKIQDANDFDAQGYDLVLVDLYQGDQFPKKFENEKFLKKLRKNKRSLAGGAGKIVIFNRLYYGEKRPEAMRFLVKLEKIFPRVEAFYPQANVMFICS